MVPMMSNSLKMAMRNFRKNGVGEALKTGAALLLILIVCGSLYSFDGSSKLSGQIESAIESEKILDGDIGVKLVCLPEGNTLYQKNADSLFVAASNNKLITTAAALHFLGPEYKFRTTLYATGTRHKNGLLDGDILLRGGGDPNISGRFYNGDTTAVFRRMIKELKKLGIKRVRGSVIGDDTFFDRQYVHPDWKNERLDRWYAAPSSALALNDNCINFVVSPGPKAGSAAKIRIAPLTRYVKIYNKCITTNSRKRHLINVSRQKGSNVITITGRFYIKAGPYKNYVAVHQPSLYAVTVFKEEMVRQGIKVDGGVRLVKDAAEFRKVKKKKVCVYESSLLDAIKIANKRSQNFYAEQILKTLGAEMKGSGSFDGGRRAVQDFLSEVGIDRRDYSFRDGSGLSNKNAFSPDHLARVLEYMYRHKFSAQYLDSLAVAGTDGSLRKRMGYAPLKGNVFAKTGSLPSNGVHALSGYVRCKGGKMVAFSILFNKSRRKKVDIRRAEEKIVLAVYRYGEDAARLSELAN